MSKTIDYEFKRGDTNLLKKFRVTDKNGNVMNLTDNEQLYFTIKTNPNSNKVLIQKTINNGICLEEDGYYHITLEPSETSKLNYGAYVYDIELKSINQKMFVKTIIEGTITLTDEVTWEGDE